jgi:non-heme chloroperoxidase
MIENQQRNRPRGMERFVSGMFGSEVDEWTVQWLWSIGMQTPMRVAVKTLSIYVDPDVEALHEALAELDVPAAVFHGAHDKSATLDEAESIASDVLKHGTFVSFENSGHVPFLEETTNFNNELFAFVEG